MKSEYTKCSQFAAAASFLHCAGLRTFPLGLSLTGNRLRLSLRVSAVVQPFNPEAL
jgi:hypothetical protein